MSDEEEKTALLSLFCIGSGDNTDISLEEKNQIQSFNKIIDLKKYNYIIIPETVKAIKIAEQYPSKAIIVHENKLADRNFGNNYQYNDIYFNTLNGKPQNGETAFNVYERVSVLWENLSSEINNNVLIYAYDWAFAALIANIEDESPNFILNRFKFGETAHYHI